MIRQKIKDILFEDLVLHNLTHENAPPHKDCYEDCGIPIKADEYGKKHKKCMDCWEEYIDSLVEHIMKVKDD